MRPRYIRGLCTLLVILLPGRVGRTQPPATPQFNQQEKVLSRPVEPAHGGHYLLYLPDEYDNDLKRRWPVLLYLHAADARGANPNLLEQEGLPYIIRTGMKLPFIVVAPLCPLDNWWDSRSELESNNYLLDEIIANYRADDGRIYLTGWSMGGAGAWKMASERPERFAAVAPLSGRAQLKYIPQLRTVPIWAFHGTDDPIVPPLESQKMVNALKAAGGNAHITLLKDAGHDIWGEVYGNSKLYDWLLGFSRKDNHS